ncbi:hypothetical protein FOL46_001285, partial [Perkinsus olseni]
MDVTLDRVEDNLVRTDDKWVIFMDSNAYNELWGKGPFGSTRQKTRGTKLARWIEGNDVRIHNDPSMPTFIRPVPGGGVNGYQSSSIDVCLSSEVDIVGWSTVDGVRPYDHLLIEAMAVTDKASIKVKRVYTRIKDKPAYYDDLKSAASDWYHDLPDFMLAMDIDVAIADVVDKIKTGKDTSMAVQKATEVMKQLTDEGKAVIALSLDMRGAFSNARHDVICTTVEEMCGSPVLFNLVSSYLHRRRCFYKGKMRLSMSFSGTPQGGVVSPCVYRIFHTVLMGIIESCSTDDVRLIPIVYADDTLVILSGDNDQAVVEAVGRLLDTLAEQLPALGLNISEEKSVLLGDKAFIERYDCVRGIKVRPAIGYLGMRLTLGGSWLPHFEEAVARARREIEMCRRLVGKDGCSALSPKGREVIRNHITGVLAYGLVCWGDRLRFKTTRDRISAVDLRLEKVLLGVPGTANPGLCALLSDRKATIYERLCVRYASLWLRGLPPSPKWWGTVVKQPYPVKGTVDHTVTNATPLPRGWVHIGNGCEVTGTITEGLAGGKVIFPEVEVVIYTDGSRTPAVDDNDDDTTRVGAGYYSDSELIGNGRVKLPHFANIAQAESLAVLEAMRKAAESGGFSTILIASDSQAILKSLLSRRKSQLSSDIVDLALSADIDFRFIWVRGHAGSTGNSIADGMARSGSIVGTFRTVPIPGSHLRELVSQS